MHLKQSQLLSFSKLLSFVMMAMLVVAGGFWAYKLVSGGGDVAIGVLVLFLLIDAAGYGLIAWRLGKTRWVYFVAYVWAFVNLVTTVTDHVGVVDGVFVALNVIFIGCILYLRRHKK